MNRYLKEYNRLDRQRHRYGHSWPCEWRQWSRGRASSAEGRLADAQRKREWRALKRIMARIWGKYKNADQL